MFSRLFGRFFKSRDYESLAQDNLLLTQELSKKTLEINELTTTHITTENALQLKIKQLQHEIELQTGANIKKSQTIKLLQQKCEELETVQRCLRKRELTSVIEKVLCRYMSRSFMVDISGFTKRHQTTPQTTRLCRLLYHACSTMREEGNFYAHNACVKDDAKCEKTLKTILDEMIRYVEGDTDYAEFLKMVRTTPQFWKECMDIIKAERNTPRFTRQMAVYGKPKA